MRVAVVRVGCAAGRAELRVLRFAHGAMRPPSMTSACPVVGGVVRGQERYRGGDVTSSKAAWVMASNPGSADGDRTTAGSLSIAVTTNAWPLLLVAR